MHFKTPSEITTLSCKKVFVSCFHRHHAVMFLQPTLDVWCSSFTLTVVAAMLRMILGAVIGVARLHSFLVVRRVDLRRALTSGVPPAVSCGRLVLGDSAKVLGGHAQGICPPHPGKWSWRAERNTNWSKRKWRRRSEWRCRSNKRDTQQCAWNVDVMMCADLNLSHACPRMNVSHCEKWTVWRVVFTHTVRCSSLLSAGNDLTAINQKILNVDTSRRHNWSHRFIMSFCTWAQVWTFLSMSRAPPKIAPLSPARGRTRWLVSLLVVPGWNWSELFFCKFLVKTA